ncbi:MAG: hypothetical protein WBQ08_01395 [Candidatus Sulfotelmatobacter sp.]
MTGTSQWFQRLGQFPAMGLTILGLILAVGCSRPSELPANEGAAQADQSKVPFQNDGAKGAGNAAGNSGEGNSVDANTDPASKRGPGRGSGAPFETTPSVPDLPPGTLVTVRVEEQIFTDKTGEEGTFAGVVDEPVIMDGKIVVPRGATVTGKIEAAQASDAGRGRGYIRLLLDTITIAGKTLPLRTSSLFVRGSAGEGTSPGQDQAEPDHPTVTRLQKGRRLTFRLAATVPQDRQETVSSGRNHPANTE